MSNQSNTPAWKESVASVICVGAGTIAHFAPRAAVASATFLSAAFVANALDFSTTDTLIAGMSAIGGLTTLENRSKLDLSKQLVAYTESKIKNAFNLPHLVPSGKPYYFTAIPTALTVIGASLYANVHGWDAIKENDFKLSMVIAPAVQNTQNDNPGKLTYENSVAVLTLAAPTPKI